MDYAISCITKIGFKSITATCVYAQKGICICDRKYGYWNFVWGKKDDFDFIISTDDNDIPMIYECYPNALQKIYQGKRCSVYEVLEEGFQRGMTSWSPELVCENEVDVKNEVIIEDLYQRLVEEEQKGNLKVYRYEDNAKYKSRIAAHIVDRLIRFEIDLKKCMEQDSRFATYYKRIIQELVKLMDGHLLL